jgi:hypothetical protein
MNAPTTVAEATEVFEDGVYFGLDEEAYHKDPALGSTDIKDLCRRPIRWQKRRLFDKPKEEDEKDSPHQLWGSALHKIVMEGREAFDAAFSIAPRKEDFEGLLVTMDDLKDFAKQIGVKAVSPKAAMIAAIREVDPDVHIWDDISETFRKSLGGRIELPPDVYEEVMLCAPAITANPELQPAFRNGVPEVSVFWTHETGIRLKARIDYLKVPANVDLKSTRVDPFDSIDTAVSNEIHRYRYFVQAAHYTEARRQVRGLINAGRVFGDCPLGDAWLKRLAAQDDWHWTWVFIAKDSPEAVGFWCQKDLLELGDDWVLQGIANYRHFTEQFGADAPWVKIEPIRHISAEDMPAWIRL